MMNVKRRIAYTAFVFAHICMLFTFAALSSLISYELTFVFFMRMIFDMFAWGAVLVMTFELPAARERRIVNERLAHYVGGAK